MNKQNKKLKKQLKSIIKQMRALQKAIAADTQPVSMHELDGLARLGKQYAKIVGKMQSSTVVGGEPAKQARKKA